MGNNIRWNYTSSEQETIRLSGKDIPEAGMLLTAYVTKSKWVQESLILPHVFPNALGYVQPETSFYPIHLVPNTSFRFLVTALPQSDIHTKRYFRAVPFRPLEPHESRRRAVLLPDSVHRLKKVACTKSLPRLDDFIIEQDLNWMLRLPSGVLSLLDTIK